MPRRYRAAIGLSLILTLPACGAVSGVGIAPPNGIECRAERDLSCGLKGCETAAGDGFHVTVFFDPAKEEGELCTFTYCRGFRLLRLPGSGEGHADGFLGATLSDSAGSTEDVRGKRVVDYLLWIAPDLKRFILFNSGDDGASGWAGACAAR